MQRIQQVRLGSVLLRVCGLAVGYVVMMLILNRAAEPASGTGADLGLILVLGLAAGCLAAVCAAGDGARWARRGWSRVQGQWTWGVAACVAALVVPVAEKIFALLSGPVDESEVPAFMAAAMLDLVLVQPALAGLLCVVTVGAFTVVSVVWQVADPWLPARNAP